MERWSPDRYSRPYLDIQAVRMVSGNCVEIDAEHGTFEVSVEGITAGELLDFLELIQRPDHPLWSLARKGELDNAWFEVVRRLDDLALLRDAAIGLAEGYDTQMSRCEATVSDMVAKLNREFEAPGLTAAVDGVWSEVDKLVGELFRRYFPEDYKSGAELPSRPPVLNENFFVAAVCLQARYLQQAAPFTLLLWHQVLSRITGMTSERVSRWRKLGDLWAGGIHDESEAVAHLSCLRQLLLYASQPTASRLTRRPSAKGTLMTGADFAVSCERVAHETLKSLGRPRFLDEILIDERREKALARGRVIEEYHVTRRFVEIITPMLRKRLSGPLRKLMFQYFSEEVGHEEFEIDNCAALGINEEVLRSLVPLPLYLAYVDIFTYIADVDPVGYLASIMITEGLIGEENPLREHFQSIARKNPLFDNAGRKHDALNVELNHSSISRLALREISVIPGDAQQLALDHLVFLLELNFRSWNLLCDFYAQGLLNYAEVH